MGLLLFFPETAAAAKQGGGEGNFDGSHCYQRWVTAVCQSGYKTSQ